MTHGIAGRKTPGSAGRIKMDEAGRIKTDEAGRIKTDEAGRIKTDEAGRIKTDEAGRTNGGFPWRRGAPTVAVLAALALPIPAGAQTPIEEAALRESVLARYQEMLDQEVLSFTIQEAVDVAAALHPDVRRERARLGETAGLVGEARADYLPSLNLRLQAARTRDPGFRNSPFFSRLLEDPAAAADSPFGGGDPEAFGGAFTFGTYVWDFSVSQLVWNHRVGPALRAARVEVNRVGEEIRETENRVARDTASTLYAYQLRLRTREVLAAAVDARERRLAVARDRLELGDGTRLDVLREQVQVARLRRQLGAVEDAIVVERAAVNALVGREQDRGIEVLDPLELPDPVPSVLPPEALLELAVQRRPAIRRLALERDLLGTEMQLARADVRPEIRANASYGINTFSVENTSDFALHNWTAGVTLNWELFDGLRTRSRVRAIRSRATQKDWERNQFESTLEVTLRSVTADWEAALAALEDATLAVEEAREAERVAQAELEAGTVIPVDVLDITQTRRDAELTVAENTHDALVALAELKYLTGYRANAPHSVISGAAATADAAADDERTTSGGMR